MLRTASNFLWSALALLSATWLAFYFYALWPLAMEAIKHQEPAFLYDPWLQIARDIDPETQAMSAWYLNPIVLGDAPTGTLEVWFDMPCWPISLGAAVILTLCGYRFLSTETRKQRSPSS